MKSDPESIKYGVQNNLKYIPKHLMPVYTFPILLYPFTQFCESKMSQMLNIDIGSEGL